jgi:hypothetical protein
MSADIVLFLRDHVPHTELIAALSEIFGIGQEEDGPLIVTYAEGFAIGVGIAVERTARLREDAVALAERLDTLVLLETSRQQDDGSDWLLCSPGSQHPLPAQPVELRHGLTVAVHKRKSAVSARAVYA